MWRKELGYRDVIPNATNVNIKRIRGSHPGQFLDGMGKNRVIIGFHP